MFAQLYQENVLYATQVRIKLDNSVDT